MKPIIVAGPTASGKTSLGINLAKRFGGVVISADSRMVYRQLDIGTGKPTWEHKTLDHSPWLESRWVEYSSSLSRSNEQVLDGARTIYTPVYTIYGIDHYGIDLVEPETPFSLTDWLAFARPLIANLQSQNIQPIIVGGTHMYLKALTEGFNPAPTDPELRAELEKLSTEALITELEKSDPETAQREAKNHRRLVRAVEVSRLGVRICDRPKTDPIDSVIVALKFSNADLYARIDQRIDERLAAGMIDEVRSLIESGISKEWLKGLGLEYRIISKWLESGDDSLENLRQKLSGGIHAFARRQLTYLRHQLPVNWFQSAAEAVSHCACLPSDRRT